MNKLLNNIIIFLIISNGCSIIFGIILDFFFNTKGGALLGWILGSSLVFILFQLNQSKSGIKILIKN